MSKMSVCIFISMWVSAASWWTAPTIFNRTKLENTCSDEVTDKGSKQNYEKKKFCAIVTANYLVWNN